MSVPDLSNRPAFQLTETVPGPSANLLEDQRTRWHRGERPLVETYLEQVPQLRADRETLLDLLYHEVLLREERGERPGVEEYERRFPQFAGEIRLQFEVHEGVEPGVGPADDPPDDPFAQGSRWPVIPGYVILSELGRGGMGVVYRAWQDSLHRLVAIKMVLPRGAADAHNLSRFRTEAEAVARLEHPNIVQIHEVGETKGYSYIALQFVDGGNLAQKLAGAPLPVRQAAALTETLARAIHYAHQRGIIHRDLTPSNVLLTDAGVPKVTDFGLAKILAGGSDQTQSGEILGTPSYMAPEQALGKVREAGPAADIYSLGAILYEMLTGRPPFKAATLLETLDLVKSQDPVPPARLQPNLPRDVETICLKCLEKEPRKRYPSAEALADDLARFLADRPVLARRVGLAERTRSWCRRNPAVASLVAAVVLLVGAIAVGSIVSVVKINDENVKLKIAQAEARANLGEAYLSQAKANRWSGRTGRRFDSLDALRKALTTFSAADRDRRVLEIRNEAITCLTLTDLRQTRWAGVPEGATANTSAFDPNLRRYAWSDTKLR
jgi:serine/threonine-protein kinase